MKKNLIKAALLVGVLFTFAYVVGDGYPVQEVLLTVLFLIGVCMIILPLFAYPDIKYKAAIIVGGIILAVITACTSYALQEIIENIPLILFTLLCVVAVYGPIVLLIWFITS